MSAVPFAIVGGGWRAEFYLRIARALPEMFRVTGVLVRNRQKAADFGSRWNVPTFQDAAALLKQGNPQFCVTSVAWNPNPDVIREVAELGLPVLSETPPAPTIPALRDLVTWARGAKARVQVAEEYHLRPLHLAQAELIQRGILGEIFSAQVSIGHGYHGISVMRRFLGAEFESSVVRGHRINGRIVQGPDRSGPPTAEAVQDEQEDLYIFTFANGRTGIMDFAGTQYFAWIRADRLLVRGSHGEIAWDTVRYLKDYRTPLQLPIDRVESGRFGNLVSPRLDGFRFGESWLWKNPYPAALMDDEIAICEMLARMSAYAESGTEFYPLEEGVHDHFLYLVAQQAVQSGDALSADPGEWSGSRPE